MKVAHTRAAADGNAVSIARKLGDVLSWKRTRVLYDHTRRHLELVHLPSPHVLLPSPTTEVFMMSSPSCCTRV